MDLNLNLDEKQLAFIAQFQRYNALYGILYIGFALLILLTNGPLTFVFVKLTMGSLLVANHIYPEKHVQRWLILLIIMMLEIYAYTLFFYGIYATTLTWLLMAPNYLFLLKNQKMRWVFIGLVLTLIITTPYLNSLMTSFDFNLESNLSSELYAITTCAIVFIVNLTTLQEHLKVNRENFDELKRNNEELEKIKNELLKSQNFQEEFFASLNHELRTPLSTIFGANDLLKAENANPELVKTIEESSRLLSMLIDEFLEYENIQNEEVTLNKKEFNLYENLEKIASVFSFRFNEKAVDFDLKIHSNTPQYVLGDSKRLNQILLNVIGNCIKNSVQNSISLSVKPISSYDNHVKLQFIITSKLKKDLNIIKNAKYQENMFSLMGLELTKKIIKMKRGKIDIEKFPNDGYKYIISLDYEIGSPPEIEIKTEEKIVTSFSGPKKILIVDDNKINLTISRKQLLLKNKDFEITTCMSGRQAIELAKNGVYCIILLDIRMPEISGIQVANEIRNSENPNQNTPIVALTADITDQTHEECKEARINHVVSKPYDINFLLKIIEENCYSSEH